MPEHIRQEPKVLVSTENLTEQEWLAYRRQGIGGSDVAAILGIYLIVCDFRLRFCRLFPPF